LFQLGGYDVVVPRSFKWVLRPSDVFEYVDASAHTMGRKPDDPLWVATVFRTDPPLASQLATQADCNTTQFGLISVIEMRRRNQ
jgi:hypothetical protein